ncbi:MAG: DUF134 domain-containing protein [Nanobdellota archaeon]
MPRPRKRIQIHREWKTTYFKPQGIALRDLEEVQVESEEIEAIRLASKKGLTQQEAAISMNIPQATFNRILRRAEEKIADALTAGKAIRIRQQEIEGDTMPNEDGTGPDRKGPMTGRGLGKCSDQKEQQDIPLRRGRRQGRRGRFQRKEMRRRYKE